MNNPTHRRDFIKHASWLSLAAAAGSFPASGQSPTAGAAGAGVKRPIKISLNAYSFNNKLLGQNGAKPEMTLFDLLDFCAKQEFDGIDPTGYYFPGYPKVPDDAFIHEFKRKAFRLGIEITGTGVRNNFAIADQAKRAADVQLVKDWIVVASKMGAPVIRVFAGAEEAGAKREEVNEWLVADLKQCVEFGKQHGVVVGIQNHGDFLRTAEQVNHIVKLVDSEWFGVIVDTGNFQVGDPYEEIARVMPHAVNFQVKESPYGKDSTVPIDLKRLVQVVRASSYRAQLPIETLMPTGKPYDPFVSVPRFHKQVRAAVS